MLPAPPQWQNNLGDPNLMEQGVFHPEGVGQGGKMKMVGLGQGGNPLFEGKKGLMQCLVDPTTGDYRLDAKGIARCWYVPTTAPATQGRQWINTDSDLVHYRAEAVASSVVALGIGALLGLIILKLMAKETK